jgi:hypothetical protein
MPDNMSICSSATQATGRQRSSAQLRHDPTAIGKLPDVESLHPDKQTRSKRAMIATAAAASGAGEGTGRTGLP